MDAAAAALLTGADKGTLVFWATVTVAELTGTAAEGGGGKAGATAGSGSRELDTFVWMRVK